MAKVLNDLRQTKKDKKYSDMLDQYFDAFYKLMHLPNYTHDTPPKKDECLVGSIYRQIGRTWTYESDGETIYAHNYIVVIGYMPSGNVCYVQLAYDSDGKLLAPALSTMNVPVSEIIGNYEYFGSYDSICYDTAMRTKIGLETELLVNAKKVDTALHSLERLNRDNDW